MSSHTNRVDFVTSYGVARNSVWAYFAVHGGWHLCFLPTFIMENSTTVFHKCRKPTWSIELHPPRDALHAGTCVLSFPCSNDDEPMRLPLASFFDLVNAIDCGENVLQNRMDWDALDFPGTPAYWQLPVESFGRFDVFITIIRRSPRKNLESGLLVKDSADHHRTVLNLDVREVPNLLADVGFVQRAYNHGLLLE